MVTTLRIAHDALRFIVRSAFFWAWNCAVFFLVLSLHYLTYFDFEGGLVSELFLTTLALSGAVNAVVFYLNQVEEISLSQWGLLITRPIRPIQLMIGRWLAIVGFQIAVSLLLVGGHLFVSRLLRRSTPTTFWMDWYFSILQIGMLSTLYGLISILLKSFWASTLMVTVFFLGHLSEYVMNWLPDWLSVLGSLSFSIIPDLELSSPRTLPGLISPSGEIILWNSVYAIIYCIVIVYINTLALRRMGAS